MKFKLNKLQVERLSEFSANISLVFIASMIAPMFSDKIMLNFLSIIVGLVLAVLSLFISLALVKTKR